MWPRDRQIVPDRPPLYKERRSLDQQLNDYRPQHLARRVPARETPGHLGAAEELGRLGHQAQNPSWQAIQVSFEGLGLVRHHQQASRQSQLHPR